MGALYTHDIFCFGVFNTSSTDPLIFALCMYLLELKVGSNSIL
jgi:hypothetical protein